MADDTYGEILAGVLDEICKYDDRADVLRRNEIPKGHYYNVINPHKKTSGDRPFYCPTEWGVRLTRDGRAYDWIKTVARDCGCLCLTPEDIKKLKTAKPEETLELFQQVIGAVKGK